MSLIFSAVSERGASLTRCVLNAIFGWCQLGIAIARLDMIFQAIAYSNWLRSDHWFDSPIKWCKTPVNLVIDEMRSCINMGRNTHKLNSFLLPNS